MKNILLMIGFVLLSGCSAQMVSARKPIESAYAPVNEKEIAGGTVKYLAKGTKTEKAMRRESAYKKMFNHCGGAYRITNEHSQTQYGAIVPTMYGAVPMQADWWYIDFQCETAQAKS